MVTEYFAHVFRTSLVPMKISSKFTHEGREYDITKLAALPIFDTSGDKSQGTTSFYDIMQDETLGIEPKERAEILSYLGFLSDVSGLASTTI